ncbi:MAG: MloB [Lysobacter sp.]|nr:MAG: MloB [Lysobacter sp.]
MKSLSTELSRLLSAPKEGANLEFKEAKKQFDTQKLMKYCTALANEGGGWLILGVNDDRPRKVVGTSAFLDLQDIRRKIIDTLGFRVEVEEVILSDGRVIGFFCPPRPAGTAYQHEGAYWMRSGEDLKPMTEDRLRSIFLESAADWLDAPAISDVNAASVVDLLDTQSFFDLLKLPYPSQQTAVIDRLASERLISADSNGWSITRMAAILFAKRLDAFPTEVARKAIRAIVYDGNSKLKVRTDRTGNKGYACGFANLIDFIYDSAPANRVVEETIRKEIKMFPRQAVRELVANALVHQDFSIPGAGVMIELYSDRLEISNPGLPQISVSRFIDEQRSRNDRLAGLMRRMGICEERGSGIDKVVTAAEVHQLPAPDFRAGEVRTTCILFAHQDFSEMSKVDRIRACYQHCCLMFVTNQRMTNQSLRKRFNLPEAKAAVVSQTINAAIEAGQIRLDDSESTSRRYAKYVPCWG